LQSKPSIQCLIVYHTFSKLASFPDHENIQKYKIYMNQLCNLHFIWLEFQILHCLSANAEHCINIIPQQYISEKVL